MHDRNLEAIINDPASTQEEKAAAQAALRQVEHDLHEDTRKLLDVLKVKSIADLNEGIFERYVSTHSVRSNDWIVKEFRFWIPPDDSFLAIMGMSIADWWLTVHRIAAVANRPDAEAYARRKMQEG
jgi:hypothetical protein